MEPPGSAPGAPPGAELSGEAEAPTVSSIIKESDDVQTSSTRPGRPRVGKDLKPHTVWVSTASGRSRRVSGNDKGVHSTRPHRHDACKFKMTDFVPLQSLRNYIPPTPVDNDPMFLSAAFDNLVVKVKRNDAELREVHLKGNRITNEGCIRLAEALKVLSVQHHITSS